MVLLTFRQQPVLTIKLTLYQPYVFTQSKQRNYKEIYRNSFIFKFYLYFCKRKNVQDESNNLHRHRAVAGTDNQ